MAHKSNGNPARSAPIAVLLPKPPALVEPWAESRYSALNLETLLTAMPKGQIKVLVCYALFMLALTQFLQHSTRFHGLLEPLAALFGALLPIGISLFAIKNGWALGRVRQVDRLESPVSFWLLVALGWALGAYLVYQGVRGLAVLAMQAP